MKIVIIGAGASGLVTLKYAIDDGYSCDLYEQTGSAGGTFVYTDSIDLDENGFPVHSAMYKDLRINLPKEIMAFSGFPYPEQENSFIGQPEVLTYYQNYADHFNLKKHIQFYKRVTKVEPAEGTKWIIKIFDLRTKTEVTSTYDAVFVCNGHYSSPIIPEIPGQNIFQGLQLHCYKYRSPNLFKDKKVLVVGSGPSGADVGEQIATVAKHVFLVVSQKFYVENKAYNITEKSKIVRFCTDKVIFNDGTKEIVDAILYCTGYRYSIPFLGDNCGVTVAKTQVSPLFKHIVNIQHPTMFFIGILSLASLTMPIWDLQARFALAALGKKFHLPEENDMMKDFETENLLRQENGAHPHHLINVEAQRKYFQCLSDLSGIENLPLVLTNIFDFHMKNKGNKRICYKILDNENFEHHIIKENTTSKI